MSRPGGNIGLLSDQQVDIIATRLAKRLSAPVAAKSNVTPVNITATNVSPPVIAPSVAPSVAPREALGEGVFETIDAAVAAAGVAFRELDGLSL